MSGAHEPAAPHEGAERDESRDGLAVYLGEVDYGVAWRLQQLLVEERARAPGSEATADGPVPRDLLLLCQHPDVITVGRRQRAQANILLRRFPLYEIERGGDVTYHGPGQLVGYPILWLRPAAADAQGPNRWGERDLHAYLRNLEEGLCRLCADCGVPAGRREGLTGVWTADGERKLVSLGIAVRRWVTFHGFALNVTTDLSRFYSLNPCGLSAQVMASLAELGARLDGQPVSVTNLLVPAARCVGQALGRRFHLTSLADSGLFPLLEQARREAMLPVSSSGDEQEAS